MYPLAFALAGMPDLYVVACTMDYLIFDAGDLTTLPGRLESRQVPID